MPQSKQNLIWIDLEMTGLDTRHDHIIEIATVITDARLDVIAEGPVVAIDTPEHVLAGMDDWNTRHHTASGLLQRVRQSTCTVAEAERLTLEFVKQHVAANKSPLCGNSICQDRRFMARLMPELEAYFHYRNLDVSTIKILFALWAPDKSPFQKESQHRALQDIHDSIEELKFYREQFFTS